MTVQPVHTVLKRKPVEVFVAADTPQQSTSETSTDATDNPSTPQLQPFIVHPVVNIEHERSNAQQRAGVLVGISIVCGLIVLSIVMAFVAFSGPIVAVAALVIFAFMVMLGAPFWLTLLTEAIDKAGDRITGQ